MLHRETLLDTLVNVIPMAMILFFIGVLFVADQWDSDPFVLVLALGLHVVPFVLLGLLTWVSARAIQGAEIGE